MIDERVEVLMRDLDKLDTMLPRTEVQDLKPFLVIVHTHLLTAWKQISTT